MKCCWVCASRTVVQVIQGQNKPVAAVITVFRARARARARCTTRAVTCQQSFGCPCGA